MKISVVGWYGIGNIGDEAFKPAIERIFDGHELEFVRPPRRPRDPDLVVLGGGAVVSPFYLTCLPERKRRYALGVDLAYESEIELLANGGFSGVMFRNRTDAARFAHRLAVPTYSIPDLAFMIRPSGRPTLERFHPDGDSAGKKVAVCATDYVNPAIDRPVEEFGESAYSFAVSLAQELDQLTEQGWTVYLLCCSTGGYGDDRRMALQLKSFMEHPPVTILDSMEPQEMVDFIAEMDLSICMRFHSHIFSTIAGTPFVSIEFTRKVKVYLEELGLREETTCAAFLGRRFDTSHFHETVRRVLERQGLTAQLRDVAASSYDELENVMHVIRREWLAR
jgi:polysaccharide pyruvyl transferase WcaK-like protein